jgi:tRNA nucleotidyltransferase/poly(A) polymerase
VKTFKFFLVGGAVRDKLLGLEPKDLDYVVVGSTTEEMLAFGFKQVGLDFPVFIHPTTGAEFALARTEHKTGTGYSGFTVNASRDTTLYEDLQRRDLTINSMAMDDDGTIVDPFNGQEDLKNRILRHTSEAFADDPLRVLRLARFAARYNFAIAPETIVLARKLVKSFELSELSNDRMWKEINRAMSEPYPERFFDTLILVDAFKGRGAFQYTQPPTTKFGWYVPFLHDLFHAHLPGSHYIVNMPDIGREKLMKFKHASVNARLAVITAVAEYKQNHFHEEAEVLKLSSAVRTLAEWLATCDRNGRCLTVADQDAETILHQLTKVGLLRDGVYVAKLLEALEVAEGMCFFWEGTVTRLKKYREACLTISGADLLAEGFEGVALGQELFKRRVELIKNVYA